MQAQRLRKTKTVPEITFEKILKQFNVFYEDQKTVGYLIYDFFVPSKNLLVEVDGDYYHANPSKYTPEQLNEMQKRNVLRDNRKNILAKGMGYDLVRFWEDEIINSPDSVKKKLQELLEL